MPDTKTMRNNIFANSFGRIWVIGANIIFVPLYLKFLGSEAYGMVVFYTTMTATLQVLDAGLSSALSRELARRLSVSPDDGGQAARSASDLARTVEVLSWLTGVTIGLVIFVAAPAIAGNWLHTNKLPLDRTTLALRLIGAVIAVQWPSTAYSGALMGMQRQVKLNAVRMSTASLQALCAIGVLWLVVPTIEAYFLCVLVAQGANTLWLRWLVWQSLSEASGERSKFRWAEIVGVRRFAAGMASIAFLTAILTQADKIILSKLVSLSEFAAYGIAFTIGSVLSAVGSPVFLAAVPRFTELLGAQRTEELRSLYLLSSELVALLVIPGWVILQFHAHAMLVIWMGPGSVVEATTPLLQILSSGFLFNAMVTLPCGLQIASGWTSLSVIKNIITVIIAFPALLGATFYYGASGAAAVWVAVNLGYVLFEVPIMHKRLLRGSTLEWYGRALALPIFIGVGIGLLSQQLMPQLEGRLLIFLWLSFLYLSTTLTIIAALPALRRAIKAHLVSLLLLGRRNSI